MIPVQLICTRLALLSLLLIGTIEAVTAQEVRWVTRFGGPESENMHDVAELKSGDFIAVGGSGSFLEPHQTFGGIAARISSEGQVQWEKYYAPYKSLFLQKVLPDDSGAVLIGNATVLEDEKNVARCWIGAIDLGGTLRWSALIGREGVTAIDATRDVDSTIMIVGGAEGGICLIRISPGGAVLSDTVFAPGSNAYPRAISGAPGGGFVVAGQQSRLAGDQLDFAALRVGENGDSLWFRTYGTSLFERAFAVTPLVDGGFLLGGLMFDVEIPGQDYHYFVTIDDNGVFMSSQRIDSAGENDVYGLELLSSGHVAVAGRMAGNSMFGLTEPDGTVKEMRQLPLKGGSGAVTRIIESADGSYILAGGSSAQGFVAKVTREISTVDGSDTAESVRIMDLY